MKKVGIVTITSGNNFGNRLQNYALTNIIEKNGYICETIHNNDKKSIKALVKSFLKNTIFYKKYYRENNRNKSFKRFNKSYIKFSNEYVTNNDSKGIENKYDYFVCGSDQIWNLNYKENGFINFLGFCNSSKKISYSASFGSNFIPNDYNVMIKKWLMDYKAISVRENSGLDIIKHITNNKKNAIVTLDPTLLLDANEWKNVEKKPLYDVPNNYLLMYFLGELSDYDKNIIKIYAKENDLEIIDLYDKESKYYESGPSEFLYLERNAKIICTDSYHSCVFSFIFNIPFIVFERKEKGLVNMNARIDTLLNNFKLDGRKFDGKHISKENIIHDYKEGFDILNVEKNKSLNYLLSSLKEGGTHDE